MAAEKLKARRAGGRERKVVYILLGAAVALVLVIGVLLLQSPLFRQPTQVDIAYAELLAAVEQNPNDPALLMTLAEIEWELGKRGDSLDHAADAAELGAEVPDINFRHAMLLIKAERIEQAKAALEVELGIIEHSRSANVRFLLAQVMRELDDLEGAEGEVKVAVELADTDGDMIIFYAQVLAELGKTEEAIAQYESARRFLPNDPRIVEGLEALGVTVEPTATVDPHGSTPTSNP